MKFKLEVGQEKYRMGLRKEPLKKWELNACGSFVNLRTEDFFAD